MKKFVSIFVTAALITVFLMSSAFAAEDPQIIVDSATAAPGEEVVLTVSLVNNPGITNGKISVTYDENSLEFVDFVFDETPRAFFVVGNPESANMNFVATSDYAKDSVFFAVKLKVKDGAVGGEYKVGLNIELMKNNAEEDVVFTVVEGVVTVHICQAGEPVIENRVDATCTTDGSYDEVVYCTCRKELSRNTVVVPATGHRYAAVVTDPTCTEQGYTTYTCHCGESYVDDYVDPSGHEMGQWYVYRASTGKVKGELRCDCAHCDYYESELLPYLGDVNGDDKVNTTDAKLIMQYDLGLIDESSLELAVGDVNGDGEVNTTDAKLIMQFDLGMIEDFLKAN